MMYTEVKVALKSFVKRQLNLKRKNGRYQNKSSENHMRMQQPVMKMRKFVIFVKKNK